MNQHRAHPINDARAAELLALRAGRSHRSIRIARSIAVCATALLLGTVARARPAQDAPPPAENTNADETPEAPPAIVIVEGQVTDPMGSGVEGAVVTVRRKTADGSEGALVGTAKTDQMGDFKVEVPEPMQAEVVVTIERDPFAPIVREVRVGEGEYPPFIGEEMQGKLVLVGEVVDARTSKPVAGANIKLEINYSERFTESDEAGRFRIENLSPGRGEVAVEAEGFGREVVPVESLPDDFRDAPVDTLDGAAPEPPVQSGEEPAGGQAEPSDVRVLQPENGDEAAGAGDPTGYKPVPHGGDIGDFGLVQVTLKPERVLNLTVVDDLGKPIEGVAIELLDEPRTDFRTLITGEGGKVQVRGVHYDAAILGVRLTEEDHVSDFGFDREIATPADQIESSHELTMDRAGRITGRVTSAESRAPIPGARVMTGEEATDFSPRDYTTPEGRFTITGVPPGPCVITVHARGYAPELKTVEVKVGEAQAQDVRLKSPAMVRGVVRNKDDEPVEGAFIDATKWRGYATLGLRSISGETGEFVFADAPHDAFEVVAYAHGSDEATATVSASDAEPVTLVLPDAPKRPAGGSLASVNVGDAAPEFSVTTLSGEKLTSAELEGKTVLIDFWATWCGPCVAELPHVKKMYEQFGKRDDFVLIGMSLDFDRAALESFVKAEKMTWHHAYADDGAQAAADAFGVQGIPAMFLLDGEGKVIAANMRGEGIVSAVESALPKK